MGRTKTSYTSAAAVVGDYLSAINDEKAAAGNSKFRLESDVLTERKTIQDKIRENREQQKKQNQWRGIARVGGTIAGAVTTIATGSPLAGKAVAGAISAGGQSLAANKFKTKGFKEGNFKFSENIIKNQNEALQNVKDELGMKIALGSFSDAMTAGNIGELVNGGLNKIAANKFQNKITDMGIQQRVSSLTNELPADLNVMPMSDNLKRVLQSQKEKAYDFSTFGKYNY